MSRLQRFLVASGRQSRFVEGPHATVGPRVGLDIANAGAGHLEIPGLSETIFCRLQQHLECAAIILALLGIGRARQRCHEKTSKEGRGQGRLHFLTLLDEGGQGAGTHTTETGRMLNRL